MITNYNSPRLGGWIKCQFLMVLNYNLPHLGGVDQVLILDDIEL